MAKAKKLGSGARKTLAQAQKIGAAVAAKAGMAKYGKKRMVSLAKKGKK